MKNSNDNFVKYINQLEEINRAAREDPKDFVRHTEEAFYANLRDISNRIANGPGYCKVIMLAGPSSSGKTTTAHILVDALKENGIKATIISLDNFYRGEKNAPLLPNGQHDYESVDALDVPEVERCLLGLMENSCCDMPVFDFVTRTPKQEKRHVELAKNEIAIVEGIHGLNPIFCQHLPATGYLKIYISIKQGIDDHGKLLFDPNDMRLVRRIVRDCNFRGTTAERTLNMWQTVMNGEYQYIKPFRGDADITINSLHIYEPCVLREQAIPLLRSVPEKFDHYRKAQHLLHSLEKFQPIPESMIPEDSLIREFIGGGIYGQ